MSRSNPAVRKAEGLEDLELSTSTFRTFDPGSEPALSTYCGIFCISAAVLLYELAVTRIFAVVLWSNLAFMVVSTALFGFGLSGVFLALRKSRTELSTIPALCYCVAASIIASHFVISYVPFRMWEFSSHPENYLYLAIWEMVLVVPFFFAGLSIANLIGSYPLRASRLYGVDLLGAALGSLALTFIITPLGGVGTLFASAMLALCAAGLFSSKGQNTLRILTVATFVILGILAPKADDLFPLKFHQHKRNFGEDQVNEPILATRWSSLSRVDIGEETTKTGPMKGHELRAVWIDGGTNASVMLKMEGEDIDKMEPLNWNNIAAPYFLKQGTNATALIIGSSGGRETLFALTHGVAHVDAVEMDPSIVHFVNQPENAKYMGYVYQNPRVTLINDEGRAFLKRMPLEHYDVIQSVNNYTPVAMAAGALNLSETFLITEEAFNDYLDHLKPDGIVSLHRGATAKVALTAIKALRSRGVEHPERHIVIANGDYDINQLFLLKKSEWTEAEVERLHDEIEPINHFGPTTFLWTPFSNHQLDPYYTNLMRATPEKQQQMFTGLGVNITPTTDDRPFIEHYSLFGSPKLAPGTPNEFKKRETEKWQGIVPRGDFPYVVILAESALLAFLFVGVPLMVKARGSFKAEGFLGFVGFFAALGFSFIVVEICLMKRYVLFLGHPAYSITTILVALLCGAGIGSLLSERFTETNARRNLTVAMLLLAVALVGQTWIAPLMFAHFLHLELLGRILVTSALLVPLGILMGMPFTIGIALIAKMHQDDGVRRNLIAWAWGINGYTTVIGSAATVFVAISFGFQAALLTATAGYLLGLLAIRSATRNLA